MKYTKGVEIILSVILLSTYVFNEPHRLTVGYFSTAKENANRYFHFWTVVNLDDVQMVPGPPTYSGCTPNYLFYYEKTFMCLLLYRLLTMT